MGAARHKVRQVYWSHILKGFECCSKELGFFPEGNMETWSFFFLFKVYLFILRDTETV